MLNARSFAANCLRFSLMLAPLVLGLAISVHAAQNRLAVVPQTVALAAASRIDTNVAAEIEWTLREHYRPRHDDPRHIGADLAQLARYYALYPDVVRLIRGLNDHPWELAYGVKTWTTRVVGNRIRVRHAVVSFDLRVGAQLKFRRRCDASGVCLISPADALLHELLHIDSMFNDTPVFLADGGLSGVLYAYAHESRVIRAENRLYRHMTSVDARPRPQRSRHRGQATLVACVTCIN